MHRLILGFAGRIYHIIVNLMLVLAQIFLELSKNILPYQQFQTIGWDTIKFQMLPYKPRQNNTNKHETDIQSKVTDNPSEEDP